MAKNEIKLEPKLVGNITGKFFVPGYQRGYRWGRQRVRDLLDDIAEYMNPSCDVQDEFYYPSIYQNMMQQMVLLYQIYIQ